MSKLQKGQDILEFWRTTGKGSFGFNTGDVVQLKSNMWYLEQMGAALYLVPLHRTTDEPRQITITKLQDDGYKVVGNVNKNPLIKILYGS